MCKPSKNGCVRYFSIGWWLIHVRLCGRGVGNEVKTISSISPVAWCFTLLQRPENWSQMEHRLFSDHTVCLNFFYHWLYSVSCGSLCSVYLRERNWSLCCGLLHLWWYCQGLSWGKAMMLFLCDTQQLLINTRNNHFVSVLSFSFWRQLSTKSTFLSSHATLAAVCGVPQ